MPIVAQPARNAVTAYLRNSAAPVQAAALTLPLLVIYGIGILISPNAANGVDFITSGLFEVVALSGIAPRLAYMGFYGLLIAVNIGLFIWLSRRNQLNTQYFLPLLLECGTYAVLTGLVSSKVTNDLTHVLNALPLNTGIRQLGVFDGVVVSAGAGLHEELVFRLGAIGLVGRVWLGKDWRRQFRQLAVLALFSSLVFSLAHYLGPEDFQITSFVFRTVSGLLFAGLFLARGFAVAAWTHALYDVWVIVLMGA